MVTIVVWVIDTVECLPNAWADIATCGEAAVGSVVVALLPFDDVLLALGIAAMIVA